MELTALRLISEQATVPLDQLARFLVTDRSGAEELVAQLKSRRLARADTLLAGDAPWVWLTRKGAAQAATGLSHRTYSPDVAFLAHRRAVNELRLYLERREPEGRWVSETELGQRLRGSRVPDGLFEVGGERHAIEVELSPKSRRDYRQVLKENSDRYDAVVYFCGSKTRRLLDQVKKDEDWPKLIVRNLPGAGPTARRARRDRKRQPTAAEREILHLLAEQGAIRTDQLARFIDRDMRGTERVVQKLHEANLTAGHRFLPDESDWIALTFVGNRLADTGLEWFQPRVGGVKQWHALNEARLYIESRSPAAKWTSRRLLIRGKGRFGSVPGAEVLLNGKRYAINVRLTPNNRATLVPRTDLQNDAYDAVVFFCATPRSRLFMERLLEENRWSKVVIRDLPRPQSIRIEQRPVNDLVDTLLGPRR